MFLLQGDHGDVHDDANQKVSGNATEGWLSLKASNQYGT